MFQDAMDLSDTGMFELRRRLEAYADARLTPGLDATIRMRAYVMTAAHRRAGLLAASPAVDAADATTGVLTAERSRAARSAWRRPAAALAAASLAVALVAGTVSASRPGGLLYTPRIWIEMANLPANVIDRANAEIGRLDARILEAQEASTAGDGPAAQAALATYSTIVVEAGLGSAGDPTATAAIEITISRHLVVLTALADSVPAPARAAVQQALSSSTKVLDDLEGATQDDGRDRSLGDSASRSTRPDGPRSTDPDKAAPGGTTPAKSQKPDKSAAPDEVGPEGAQGSPPPGQVQSGGKDKGPASRPSHAPAIPERKPPGPKKLGDT